MRPECPAGRPEPSWDPASLRLVTFTLVAAAFAWVMLAPGYWVFTANAGVILAVTALGLLVVVGWAGEVSLAQAGLTGTAIYICAHAYRPTGLDWPFLVAAAFAVLVVVLLSVLVALATARLSGVYIMVLTLALQVTIERTVFTHSIVAGGIDAAVPRPSLLGVELRGDRSYFWFSVVVLAGVLLFLVRLRSSRFGRGLLLVGTDRQVASAVGVSPWRSKIFAFVIAGFCAGIAGVLTAPLYTTPPSYVGYTSLTSLLYLAVPVLAGFRSLIGVTAVAMAFVLIPQVLEPYRVPPFALGAAGLLLGTLVGPGGFSGMVLDRMHSWQRARGKRAQHIDVRELAEIVEGTELGVRKKKYARAVAVLEEYLPKPKPTAHGDALAARDISVAFGGVQALRGASITVPVGQLVGLIGPNGAGKTTLFDVINGLRVPDAGQVFLEEADITRTKPWERAALGLGRTFQASRLNLSLSVGENLLAGAYPMIPGNLAEAVLRLPRARAGMRRAEDAAWAIAELFDIGDKWHEPVGVLSFGNRRRVEIGRSLMSGPRVLLLDEPSAGLDPTAARLLFSLLKQLHRDLGLTVLLVEHYVRAVLQHCDLVYVLGHGTVVAVGTPAEVSNHPDVRSQYLGLDFDARQLKLERLR